MACTFASNAPYDVQRCAVIPPSSARSAEIQGTRDSRRPSRSLHNWPERVIVRRPKDARYAGGGEMRGHEGAGVGASAAPLDGVLAPVDRDAAPDLSSRVRAMHNAVDRAELDAEVLPDPRLQSLDSSGVCHLAGTVGHDAQNAS